MKRIPSTTVAILILAAPLSAQEPAHAEIAARAASCTVFAGSTVLAADIVRDDLPGLLVGSMLLLFAGQSSRYCLYGPRYHSFGILAGFCDDTMKTLPLVGTLAFGRVDEDVDADARRALVAGALGLIAGVTRERSCPRLGEGPPPDALEDRIRILPLSSGW